MTFLLSTNGVLKFQPYLVSAFGVKVIDNKKRRTVNLYNAYTGKKITSTSLIEHNVSNVTTGNRVGTCVIIHHELGHSSDIVFGHAIKARRLEMAMIKIHFT